MVRKNLVKTLAVGVLSVGMINGMIGTALADTFGGASIESTTVIGSGDAVIGSDDTLGAFGESATDITIDVKGTNVNVTVPTTAPFVFNENGDNLVPSNFEVTNNSNIAGVYLESISLDANNSDWELVDDTVNIKTLPVDSKKIRLKMGADGWDRLIAPTTGDTCETGVATFTSGEIDIEANSTKKLNFKVDRGAFTKDIPNGSAFGMTLKFRLQ